MPPDLPALLTMKCREEGRASYEFVLVTTCSPGPSDDTRLVGTDKYNMVVKEWNDLVIVNI